ncbi:MAG: hypothetical protein II054_06325 [Treponema sp.]|nr:hypothetical protein [Treponema sp.]
MKDITLKLVRSKIASAVISVNGKEFEVNSSFAVLSKVYNEMYGTDLSFEDIVKMYVRQTKDKDCLEELTKEIEERKTVIGV